MQTGKTALLPLVLIDKPGSDYWQSWDAHLRNNLLKTGLISPDDLYLYTITDRVDVACEEIVSFYRVFHSSRYIGELLVLRLKTELAAADIEYLNQNFSDLLIDGRIQQTKTLPEERNSETDDLFRLVLHFNQRDHGRLYQMIREINQVGCQKPESTHPEQK
jgi:hypothetical protein